MTVPPLIAAGSALAFVLGLILVLARLARGGGFAPLRRPDDPLEVIQRVGLAPRQGIAAVRAGARTLLVSYGDGGVRLIDSLDEPRPEPPLGAAAGAARVGGLEARLSWTASGVAGAVPSVAEASAQAKTPVDARTQEGASTTTPKTSGVVSPSPPAPPGGARGGRVWSRVASALRTGLAVLALGVTAGSTPRPVAAGTTPTALAASSAALQVAPQQGTQGARAAAPGEGAAPRDDEASARQELLRRELLGPEGGLPEIDLRLGREGADGLRLSGPVGTVLFIGFLTLLPTLLLLMTSFTRILVVLHLLRQALGTQSTPPAHLLAALALLLSAFVMAPTLEEANRTALVPWMDGQIDEAEMLQRASVPFRRFMLEATGESELAAFVEMSGTDAAVSVDDIPLVVLAPAFVTSELKAAFQMGFALFLPFVVIDVVVASVLMSMGMFMLPPVMVSLPFKLLLFVLVDGWSLVMGSLVRSFF
ncbi:MAG: flagellar biosynthetic protein FliP [Gemmatimonadetes bacterium]|nr:MAG: flagellar biosynthetic protein FliP [Gemmatimonadota bacterium]